MRVLMIGAGRDVKGGVAAVVNQYYESGLDKKVDLEYIGTASDGSKAKKLMTAAVAYVKFRKKVEQYDIVHVHLASRSSFWRKRFFIKTAHAKRKKVVIHLHGGEFHIFYEKECDKKQKEKVREVFDMADAVIALSEEWKEFLSKICHSEKISVIYNSVCMPEWTRSDYTDHNILFLGRLVQGKGVYDLLEAIPKVLEEISDAHFYLGGDGKMKNCMKIAEERNIEQAVTFLGWIGSGKEQWLEKCSTFVLPSYHEGMPMSILEAMSYGDVVISTEVGGIPKVIENDENGFLIDAGDVEALSQTIVSALKSDKRERIGQNAYQTIKEHFDSRANINRLVDIYQGLVGQKLNGEWI